MEQERSGVPVRARRGERVQFRERVWIGREAEEVMHYLRDGSRNADQIWSKRTNKAGAPYVNCMHLDSSSAMPTWP
jgi:hypothetical protein